jgi:hypothetical protein
MAQKVAGSPVRVAAGRPQHTIQIDNTAKIPQGKNVPSPKAFKSGRIPDVRLIKTLVNGGTAGIEQLSGLPIEGGYSYRYGNLNCKRISGH